MKIKFGFVSNSSTSSYIVITSKDNHNKVLQQLNKYDRLIFDIFARVANLENIKKFNTEIVVLQWATGNCGTLDEVDIVKICEYHNIDTSIIDEDRDNAADLIKDSYESVLNEYVQMIKKDSENCYFFHDYH